MNRCYIKVYSTTRDDLKDLQRTLKSKTLGSFVRLPTIKKTHTVRLSPNGRGYSTFKKYSSKIHKALVVVKDILQIKKVMGLLKHNIFVEVKVS